MNVSGKPIVIARYQGRRGHPVLFERSLFQELLDAPEDQGARVVVNADASRVGYVDVDDAGTVLDLDTPADLVRAGLRATAGRVSSRCGGCGMSWRAVRNSVNWTDKCNLTAAMVVVKAEEYGCARRYSETGEAPLIPTRN